MGAFTVLKLNFKLYNLTTLSPPPVSRSNSCPGARLPGGGVGEGNTWLVATLDLVLWGCL